MTCPPIILASGSAGRQMMLRHAGVSYAVHPADLGEGRIVSQMQAQGASVASIAQALATAKAAYVARTYPDHLVIGSDQILDFKGQILSKATTHADAVEKLKMLRGQTHMLHSAVSVYHGDAEVFQHLSSARLTMRDVSDAFIDDYIRADADALTSCVGAYKIEGAGAWLFSEIQGDNFTIMGMPLLPLLGFLHTEYGVTP